MLKKPIKVLVRMSNCAQCIHKICTISRYNWPMDKNGRSKYLQLNKLLKRKSIFWPILRWTVPLNLVKRLKKTEYRVSNKVIFTCKANFHAKWITLYKFVIDIFIRIKYCFWDRNANEVCRQVQLKAFLCCNV